MFYKTCSPDFAEPQKRTCTYDDDGRRGVRFAVVYLVPVRVEPPGTERAGTGRERGRSFESHAAAFQAKERGGLVSLFFPIDRHALLFILLQIASMCSNRVSLVRLDKNLFPSMADIAVCIGCIPSLGLSSGG